MIKTTKAQRLALKRVWLRVFNEKPARTLTNDELVIALNYRAFRRTVQPGPGCIMVPFAGMWLGIEPDGYTHS